MKKITTIAAMIAAVGTATGVLLTLWNWAKNQDISWMTLFAALFISLIAFLFFYFLIIEPIRKKNDELEKKIEGDFKWLKEITRNIFDAVRELQKNSGEECLHSLSSSKASSDWAKAGSPLELNASGEVLLKESNLDKIITENIEKLVSEIDKLKLDTAYDVQNKSFNVLGDFILKTDRYNRQIKSFVFNNPQVEKRNIGFSDVIFVGSILLRDEYLKRHPELK